MPSPQVDNKTTSLEIKNDLSSAIDYSFDLLQTTWTRVNDIKTVSPSKETAPAIRDYGSDFCGSLFSQIERLRMLNDQLVRINDHLSTII